jgi:hypothetical protein
VRKQLNRSNEQQNCKYGISKKDEELRLSLGAVEAEDEGDLIEKRDGEEDELNAAVASEYPDEADDQICNDADGVLDAEGVEVGAALEAGVDDVGDEGGGEKAEEPFATGEEVVLVAGIVEEVGGKEQSAQRVEEDCVEGDEEIDGEGPLRDEGQPKFPPPEVDYRKEKRGRPAKVEEGDFRAAGVLNEAGESVQQGGDA